MPIARRAVSQMQGKGIWLWQIPRTGNGVPLDIVAEAKIQGFQHVLLKCVDGVSDYANNAALDNELARRLRRAGIACVGWGFGYGTNPAAEARRAAEMCKELGHTEYIYNAEIHYERKSDAGDRMREFLRVFREETGGAVTLGLSSFALPRFHGKFPYEEALARAVSDEACDYFMPQIYCTQSKRHAFLRSPVEYLRKVTDQVRAFSKCPIIPTFRAYLGDGMGDWQGVRDDLKEFFEHVGEFDVTAFNWWVWQSAEDDPSTWKILRDFQFPGSPASVVETPQGRYEAQKHKDLTHAAQKSVGKLDHLRRLLGELQAELGTVRHALHDSADAHGAKDRL